MNRYCVCHDGIYTKGYMDILIILLSLRGRIEAFYILPSRPDFSFAFTHITAAKKSREDAHHNIA